MWAYERGAEANKRLRVQRVAVKELHLYGEVGLQLTLLG
jgi:hypothetical protein